MIGDIRKYYYSNIIQSVRECGYKRLKTLLNIERGNMSKWPKTNFEKKVFLKMVLRLRFFDFLYKIENINLRYYFAGNLREN